MCFAHTPVSRQEAHEEHVEMQMERYPDMTEAEKVMEEAFHHWTLWNWLQDKIEEEGDRGLTLTPYVRFLIDELKQGPFYDNGMIQGTTIFLTNGRELVLEPHSCALCRPPPPPPPEEIPHLYTHLPYIYSIMLHPQEHNEQRWSQPFGDQPSLLIHNQDQEWSPPSHLLNPREWSPYLAPPMDTVVGQYSDAEVDSDTDSDDSDMSWTCAADILDFGPNQGAGQGA